VLTGGGGGGGRGKLDEVVSEGFPPEQERRWRGGATAKKTGSGLNSLRRQRKAQGSEGERGGEGRGCSGVYIGDRGALGTGNV
jgi:hypothetical protein